MGVVVVTRAVSTGFLALPAIMQCPQCMLCCELGIASIALPFVDIALMVGAFNQTLFNTSLMQVVACFLYLFH